MDNKQWSDELRAELLENILPFWINRTADTSHGGFIGEINHQMEINAAADKGLVLNARILWTFSAAYRYFPEVNYAEIAERSYRYIMKHFQDKEYGGFYWSVDYAGKPSELKKQVYGQSFVIYALTEYYRAFQTDDALQTAITVYRLLEQHAHDEVHQGYIEALSRDWKPTANLSLSDKDLNEKKSMNTHLHVMEAYTNLYRVWTSDELRNSLSELIQLTLQNIIDPDQHRFRLFFGEDWEVKSDHVSYGHDIEGSWLLVEAAEVLGDHELLDRVRRVAVDMAQAVYENGTDNDGGIWNEADGSGLTDANKDWWPQAEAMVGFYNAYQLSGNPSYRTAALNAWHFIKTYIVDKAEGEWHWGVDQAGRPLPHGPKVSAWKCPYHNSRACLELLERLA